MPAHYPCNMDYSQLKGMVSSILDERCPVPYVGFFPAEHSKDYPRAVVQLDLGPKDTLQPEEYQGICAVLMRFFRKEVLKFNQIIIHDAHKIYSLNEHYQVESNIPRGRLFIEPGEEQRIRSVDQEAKPQDQSIGPIGHMEWFSREFMEGYSPGELESSDTPNEDKE